MKNWFRHLRQRFLKLEFLIPGSPTEAFCSQVVFFRLALLRLPPPYRTARVVFCCGNEAPGKIPEPWMERMNQVAVEVHRVSEENTRLHGIFAQVDARFDLVSPRADLSIFCDADTFVARPFDEVLGRVIKTQAIAGSIAHLPLPQQPQLPTSEVWNSLFLKFLHRPSEEWFRHTLLPLEISPANSICPFYLNYGVVMAPPQVWRRLKKNACGIRQKLMKILDDPWYSGQAALALAIHKCHVPHEPLPLRYNYPNDPVADRLWPDERRNAAIYHYLRRDAFDRAKFLTSPSEFARFQNLPLEGSNADIQRCVKEIAQDRRSFEA
jgi:hypothetical protein